MPYFHFMGEAELYVKGKRITIRSNFFFYGDAANESLALLIAEQISTHWNEPAVSILTRHGLLQVLFDIKGFYNPQLKPEEVWYNDDPLNNYFRVEEYADQNISFVDGIGSNTGYLKLDNLLQTSTTAAHEYGHTIGLDHPNDLDLRGKGVPGIMYPRGTWCDAELQYDPLVLAGEYGGFMNPIHRKVLAEDVLALKLGKLHFDERNRAIVGAFSSVYHAKHEKV